VGQDQKAEEETTRTLAMRGKGHRLGIFITVVATLVFVFGATAKNDLVGGLGFIGITFGYLLARLCCWFRSANWDRSTPWRIERVLV
jgi:hypothetical protein